MRYNYAYLDYYLEMSDLSETQLYLFKLLFRDGCDLNEI